MEGERGKKRNKSKNRAAKMYEARDMDTRVRRTNRKWRGYLSQGANRENSGPSRITWIDVHELCYNKPDGQLSSHVSFCDVRARRGRQRPTRIRNDTARFISILPFCLPLFPPEWRFVLPNWLLNLILSLRRVMRRRYIFTIVRFFCSANGIFFFFNL